MSESKELSWLVRGLRGLKRELGKEFAYELDGLTRDLERMRETQARANAKARDEFCKYAKEQQKTMTVEMKQRGLLPTEFKDFPLDQLRHNCRLVLLLRSEHSNKLTAGIVNGRWEIPLDVLLENVKMSVLAHEEMLKEERDE